MEFILNPIVVSVVVLCALCLARVNVLLALIAASLVAGLTGGLGLTKSMELLSGGFSANATTALSYILLGTFAVAIAHTGLMQMLVRWIGAKMGGKPLVFCFGIAFIACLSQNVVPVHIAFIPLLIPPLLKLMNKMRLDRPRGLLRARLRAHRSLRVAPHRLRPHLSGHRRAVDDAKRHGRDGL